jgi:hypothetical protein
MPRRDFRFQSGVNHVAWRARDEVQEAVGEEDEGGIIGDPVVVVGIIGGSCKGKARRAY